MLGRLRTRLWTRGTVETVARVHLLLLAPLPFLLVALAVGRRGAWLVLLVPAALLLAAHAGLVVRMGLQGWGRALGSAGVVVAMVVLAAVGLGPALGLYRTVTVLSGSMQPAFDSGDVIVVTPAPPQSLHVGDVITYQVPVRNGQVESHRVVRILEHGRRPVIRTKGDANTTADPWTARLDGGPIWRYRFSVPLVGYAILALRAPLLHRVLVVLLPALLALFALTRIWLPVRFPRPGLRHARLPT